MKNLRMLLFICLALLSTCAAQTHSNFGWKIFDFSDSGIQIALPCEPSKEAKIFQKEPKLAQRYAYECKKDNLDFSVSLAEHFGEFDPNKTKENFDFTEKMFRQTIDEKSKLSAKDIAFQSYSAREFTIENENRLAKAIHFHNKRGSYNVQVISLKNPNQSLENFRDEFQKNTQKFFDSVKIPANE
jgi:uncharacterized DUF497 family protein